MADELTLVGKHYFSSKRASDLSGYSQDYIGQLARSGSIDAKRVSGLWYVSLDSLQSYKTQAEEYQPAPPIKESSDLESILSFDGKDYISASRASKITGYSGDYVTQLARAGKILSRQIGTRWYVDRDALVAHKSSKDSLLGAVQSESVGLARVEESKTKKEEIYLERDALLTYHNEAGDLIPHLIGTEDDEILQETLLPDMLPSGGTRVPIRVTHRTSRATAAPYSYVNSKATASPNRSVMPKLLIGTALTFVVVLSVGLASLQVRAVYAVRLPTSFDKTSMAAGAADALAAFSEFIEDHLAQSLQYKSF